MKLFLNFAAGIVLAASLLCFALGWNWDKAGRLNHEAGNNDPAFYDLGDAFVAVGMTLACVGSIGILMSIALFGASRRITKCEYQIELLRGEIEKIYRLLPVLDTNSLRSDDRIDCRGVFLPQEPTEPKNRGHSGFLGRVQE